MKKTVRKLLASTFALSLVVTSLPVFSSTTVLATESKPLMNVIGKVDDYYFLWLYCNDETGTAFTFSGKEVPHYVWDLLMKSNSFDGASYVGDWLDWYSFPDAEITTRHEVGVGYDYYVYNVVNHGDIIYTDESGESHTFTCIKDVEDYVMQTYNVTLLNIDEIPEEELPWVALSKSNTALMPSETKPEKERITRLRDVTYSEDGKTYGFYLYDNSETGVLFTFYDYDISNFLFSLLNKTDAFDVGAKFTFGASVKENVDFPDADIVMRGGEAGSGNEYYDIVNYGDIVYKDESGETHTFTCIKDVENYLIQSNSVTLLSDGATTTEPTNVPIGDVTLDGKVDLTDAICLSKICMNIISATDTQKLAGDCNADGFLTDEDITLLMEFCIGLQKELPVTG